MFLSQVSGFPALMTCISLFLLVRVYSVPVVWLLQLESSAETEINDILQPVAKGITINRQSFN